MTNAALFFADDAYNTGRPKLMGRHVAGHGFLKAYLGDPSTGDRWIYAADRASRETLQKYLHGVPTGARVRTLGPESIADLARPGCLFFPGPALAEAAWQRQMIDARGWSLCGVTHTLSSAGAMDAIAALLAAPLKPWDALVCTSAAVRDVARAVLDAQAEHLRTHLGATKVAPPELPVIPLGVDCREFAFSPDEREGARAARGRGPHDVAVLFLGRLSFHAKVHPLAMYRALERAALRRGAKDGRIVLIECGWHANQFIADAFAEARNRVAPSIGHVLLDGRKDENRKRAWAAADIFCSLSDNIQETFGLTPIEAMAAGLPSVVTDWNGYRDTVRDGVDGYRVPTFMPAPGTGSDLAARHALEIDTYDIYIGSVAQLVAVDEEAAHAALIRLIENPELRKEMGNAARARAKAIFDWPVVLASYRALWGELAARRAGESPRATNSAPLSGRAGDSSCERPLASTAPARPDPFTAFAGYASRTIGPETRVARGAVTTDALRIQRRLAMVDFAKSVLPTDETVARILDRAPATVAELHAAVGASSPEKTSRAVAWLLKMGALKIETPA
jgi:glycosyltransferase involved in cell wall biosynthesis